MPSHFPNDEHGLAYFDGTHLYEHADPRKGFHPDWKSAIFNYDRNEVRGFLLSNAIFWLDRYHADGLRMDAIASMLYLDYSRKQGEWIPNQFGGRENLGAVSLLRQVNQDAYQEFPDIQTIAEESTAWPMVSRPTYIGGLGFGMKWDMGWMHDTLALHVEGPDPPQVSPQQADLPRAVRLHRELRAAALARRSGARQRLADRQDGGRRMAEVRQPASAVRLHVHPAGQEAAVHGRARFGQWSEWNHDGSVDWHVLQYPFHQGVQRWVRDLNTFYRSEPALYETDFVPEGWRWIDADDPDNSVLTYMRFRKDDMRRS